MKNIENAVIVESSKDTKKKNIAAIIAAALVISGGIYYIQKTIRENRIKSELANKEVLNDFSVDGNNCYDRNNYFVITREDIAGNSGEDILVKYKESKNEKIDCDYLVKEGDYELLNTPSADIPSIYNSQYFSKLKDNLLIVDEGTEINHGFKIYDLEKKELTFGDSYSTGLLELEDSTLTYWRKTNDIPNAENCSKVEEYNQIGGAKIEGKVVLDISNPIEKTFEEFRCSGM